MREFSPWYKIEVHVVEGGTWVNSTSRQCSKVTKVDIKVEMSLVQDEKSGRWSPKMKGGSNSNFKDN